MNIQFDDWLKSTRQSYQDPTMWDGEVDWCKRCDSEPKYEDTDVCNSCIEELEEMRELGKDKRERVKNQQQTTKKFESSGNDILGGGMGLDKFTPQIGT